MSSAELPSIPISPRIRKSPFFEATRRWGCQSYTVYNHMYLPVFYESPEADFWHLVRNVTLWDVAVERQVEIRGRDAARLVQYMTPRDLSKTQVGQCRYVLLCEETGGIVNDPVLLKLADDCFWLSLADGDALLWAKGLAAAGGYDVHVSEPDVSPLQVQGPHSRDVMHDLFGHWVGELKYFRFRETELDGIPLVVSRTGWSNELGYEIFLCDGSRGDELWERIMAAGKSYGIRPGAPSTIRRIEAGLLSYGADMDLTVDPFELGLDRLVALDMESDCLSLPALRRIAAEGARREMIGLEIAGPALPGNEHPWPVHGPNGAVLGKVTSAVYSPRLEKNIALALLAKGAVAEGGSVSIEVPGGPRQATAVPFPFYDPRKELVRAGAA